MLILAALLAGLGVLLLVPSGPRVRGALTAAGSLGEPDCRGETGADGRHGFVRRRDAPAGPSPAVTRTVAGLAGVAVWLLMGGVLGFVAGVVVAPLLAAVLSRLESARARRDRLELIRSAPLVADLFAASLAAGAPLERALPVVARAVGGAAGSALIGVHRRIELGEPPAMAWLTLTSRPGLDGIARTVARSARTGAPLSSLLSTTADDLRSAASAAALAEVRAASVRAVLPLGLCLLPAFALLGIVPIVGGLLPLP